MASKFGRVWAIDIGNNSLRGLHVSTEGEGLEVIDFDNIRHGKILSGVTATEKDELIALSLRRFVEQNDLGKDDIVVSMPSQNSFARFVTLPPVEPKRIPEIVKFEAAQQIPFDINDVQWDWQLMTEAGASEAKVGIFAIKNDVVNSVLQHFSAENLTVNYVQMAPMALYNYVLYDRAELDSAEDVAIIALDIGAESTDLVVCTRSTVWQRSIPIGGNAFTGAIADAFRLNFERAEKLKRTAPMSKYARQIFQAMRPVFTDLASEIQRSLNFFSNSNPDTKLLKVIALGGGTKMRGLLKYLRQTLRVPVLRPDSFKRLAIGSGVSTAKFHENVSDFGIVYGLALQALGLGRIESNLLPRSVARSMVWLSKAKYFTAAACLLLLVSLMCFARSNLDRVNYSKNNHFRVKTDGVIRRAEGARKMLAEWEGKGIGFEAAIGKAFEPLNYRDVVPLLHQTIISTLPSEDPNAEPRQKKVYKAFADGDVEKVLEIPRKERKQIFITSMSVRFVDDVAAALLDERGFGKRSKRGKVGGLDRRGLEELEMFKGLSKYSPKAYSTGLTKVDTEEKAGAGFVVTIEGYSPYTDIGELIDPTEVAHEPSEWGVVTRLLHLDVNGPFKLYNNLEPDHFKFEKDEVVVDLDSQIPAGIGVWDIRYEKEKTGKGEYDMKAEHVLIDPMTKEVISKVAELDPDGRRKLDASGNPVYKVNDHWFRLRFKVVWKDAPKKKPVG